MTCECMSRSPGVTCPRVALVAGGDPGRHEPVAGGDMSSRRAGRRRRPVLSSRWSPGATREGMTRSPGATCPHVALVTRGDPGLLGKTIHDVSGRELPLAALFYKDLFFPNFSCFKRRSWTLISRLPFFTPTTGIKDRL